MGIGVGIGVGVGVSVGNGEGGSVDKDGDDVVGTEKFCETFFIEEKSIKHATIIIAITRREI